MESVIESIASHYIKNECLWPKSRIRPKNPGGVCARAKKISTRVDLTPTVALGFLLLTFFIVTTTWSQPRAMRVQMPTNGDSSNLFQTFVLPLIATGTDRVFYYLGRLEDTSKNSQCGPRGYSLNNGIGEIIEKDRLNWICPIGEAEKK